MRHRLRLDRLTRLLNASPLSQNHWAIKLGLSRGHWSDIVNGRHPFPSAKTRQRMIEVFGVREGELFLPDDGRSPELDFRLAIADRYEILQEIGQGGMGSVSLANDRTLGRLVALKVVSSEAAAGIGADALLTEIAFVARLQHPNILPLFDAGTGAGQAYYVMPYVRDGSLRALLERRGRLSLDDGLPLIDGVARALTHAHERQIIHCDVKPENILVQGDHSFLMDFGLARKIHSETLEWSGTRKGLDLSAGTPAYVSPEQASGGELDARSDVYSLACVIFETLSGRTPFTGRTTEETVSVRFQSPPPALSSLAPELPHQVGEVLVRAMAVDPSQRHGTARDLVDDLRRAADERTQIQQVVYTNFQSSPSIRRAPRPAGRLATAAAAFRFDLRYVVRSLTREWRFAAGVVLTLAIGVGLGVPVLSLADQYFLRPPSGVNDPGRLVRLVARSVGSNGPYLSDGLTGLDYQVMTTRATTLDGVAAWIILARSLGHGADARSITAGLASASFFSVLGVRPARGRFYTASEDVEDALQPPCVVSFAFWKDALGGRDDVLGTPLVIGETRYTVVGVAPPNFNGVGLSAVDVWLPLRVATPEFQGRDPLLWTTDHSSWLRIVARLKAGVSHQTAAAEAAVIYRAAGERTRDKKLQGTYLFDPLQPGRSSLGSVSAKIALWLSAGGVLLLLLVAANLANLFVARAAANARQTAVRLAIGAGRGDLVRLQAIEVLVLGVIAAALGIALAAPVVGVARALLVPGISWAGPSLDGRILRIAFLSTLAVGVLIAAWSTAHSLRTSASDVLRSSASHTTASRRAAALRRVLLVTQAAVFAVLLAGAAAFVTSLRRATNVDVGFDVQSLYSVAVSLPADTPRPERRALMQAARDRIASLPEVASASLGYMEPWANNTDIPVTVSHSDAHPTWVLFDLATPEYLRTFGGALQKGRWIAESDRAESPLVAVVSEAFERVYWPSGSAIGQCIRVGGDTTPCRTIVGVMRDVHVTGPVDDAPKPIYYLPFRQTSAFGQWPRLFFRPRGDPAVALRSVRTAIQGLRSNLPAVAVHPVADNIRSLRAPLELGAATFTAFGVLAAVVAGVGLFSVLSYLVLEQRRAHAIRLAVGASPLGVARSIVEYGLATAALGLAIGGVVLVPVSKLVDPLLYHATLVDPLGFGGVIVFGVLVALVATVAPARTVAKTDIVQILRE